MTYLDDLLAYAWELIAAGFIAGVLACIWLGQGRDYSGAPVEDDGEEVPYDPGRFGDWQYAEEVEAL